MQVLNRTLLTATIIFSAYVAALREYMLFAGFAGLRATLGKKQMPNPFIQKIKSRQTPQSILKIKQVPYTGLVEKGQF